MTCPCSSAEVTRCTRYLPSTHGQVCLLMDGAGKTHSDLDLPNPTPASSSTVRDGSRITLHDAPIRMKQTLHPRQHAGSPSPSSLAMALLHGGDGRARSDQTRPGWAVSINGCAGTNRADHLDPKGGRLLFLALEEQARWPTALEFPWREMNGSRNARLWR